MTASRTRHCGAARRTDDHTLLSHLDFCRQVRDNHSMFRIRPLLCMLMMLLMLPWGAYAGGLSAVFVAARQTVQIAEQAKLIPDDQQPLQAVSQTVVPVHKNCRSAHVPGSSCGPDMVLSHDTAPPRINTQSTISMIMADWRATEHDAAPPRDPPRVF